MIHSLPFAHTDGRQFASASIYFDAVNTAEETANSGHVFWLFRIANRCLDYDRGALACLSERSGC